MARSIDENIESLSHAVLSEAQSEAEQILTNARSKVEAVQQRAQAQASAERSEILGRATQEAERIRGQAIASAQLKARTQQLIQREAMIVEVFETARQKLASVQQRSDYEQIVTQLLREALLHLGADTARIRSDEYTSKYLTPHLINKIAGELKVTAQIGETLTQGLGIVAETLDGHRRYDATLQTHLKRLQTTLRIQVFNILIGKTP